MYDPAHARSCTVQPMGDNLKPDLTLKTHHVGTQCEIVGTIENAQLLQKFIKNRFVVHLM